VDRKVWAIVFAAAAVCAILLAHFYAVGNGFCLGPHVESFDAGCRSDEMALGLEIGATILVALAVGFWTGRTRPRV
jgi:hypothetical protein